VFCKMVKDGVHPHSDKIHPKRSVPNLLKIEIYSLTFNILGSLTIKSGGIIC
jgi:hypothetical protein